MLRRVAVRLIVLFAVFSIRVSAQSAYNFRELVGIGTPAPVPPLLSSVVEFSFNDEGDVAYIGDNGLFLRRDKEVKLIAEFGRPAASVGKFRLADSIALNSVGDLVFRGEVDPPDHSGLFLFSKGKVNQLIPDGTAASNGALISATAPAINAAGDISLIDARTNGLYLFSKGTISPLVVRGNPAPGGGTFTGISQQAIDLSDQVVFIAYLSTGGSGVFLASGGTITKIIATGDAFPDGGVFSFAVGPSINDSGQIAFGGIVSGGSANDEGLFLFSSGQLKVVVPNLTFLPNGSRLSFATSASLNNASQIAFTAFTELPNGTGVFLYSQGKVTQVTITGEASPEGDVFPLGGQLGAQINSSGQVLLLSGLTHHNDALYLYSTGQLSRVAGQGDAVGHGPRFEFPSALGIVGGGSVLIGDSTFPGGAGYYLASPAPIGKNTSLIANVGESWQNAVFVEIPDAAMNRSGQIALSVLTSDEFSEILLKSGNNLSLIAGGPGSQVSPGGQLAINNLGHVAFSGYHGHYDLFLSSNGQTSPLVSGSTPAPGGGTLNYFWSVSLNNQDQVAFFAQPSAPSQNGIFLFSSGTLTPLALNGSAAPGGGNFLLPFWSSRLGPVMNDSGEVAFAANIGSFSGGGIFLYANGALARIVANGDSAPGGGTFLGVDSPSINSSGQVAFYGVTTTGLGVFLYSGGQITRIAGAGDTVGKHTLGFVFMPRINDDGDVAFTSGESGGSEVFLARSKTAHPKDLGVDLVSSHPLPPNSVTLEQSKAMYELVIEERRNHGRRFVAPETEPSIH
jgi:hypothetical protein